MHLKVLDTALVVEFSGSGAAPFAERAEAAWAWCLTTPGRAVDAHLKVVIDDDERVLRDARNTGARLTGSDSRRLMDALSPIVTMAAIHHQAGRLLMLHAAGLADSSGRTLVLVAPSGTGKTTAARSLGRRLGYLTDETLALRDDGTIAPYPKPLSVLEAGRPHKSQVSPDAARLVRAPPVCAPAAIVVLDRDGSVEPWLEPVPVLPALARLAPETSFLARLERPLHRLAQTLSDCGGLRVLHYAEADDLLAVADELLGVG